MEWFLLFCSVYFACFLIKISRSVRKLLSALVFRTIIWIFTKSFDFCFTETNVFDELVGTSLLPSIGEIGLLLLLLLLLLLYVCTTTTANKDLHLFSLCRFGERCRRTRCCLRPNFGRAVRSRSGVQFSLFIPSEDAELGRRSGAYH